MVPIYHDKVIIETLKDGAAQDITGDYSSAEGVFEYAAPSAMQINKIVFRIKCAAVLGDGFGSGAVLGTSMTLAKESADDVVLLDLTGGVDVVDNDDLQILVDNDISIGTQSFIGSTYLSINTGPMKLVTGERLVARFNDDMSSRVTSFNILINGVSL